jgi:hypothetical protein
MYVRFGSRCYMQVLQQEARKSLLTEAFLSRDKVAQTMILADRCDHILKIV